MNFQKRLTTHRNAWLHEDTAGVSSSPRFAEPAEQNGERAGVRRSSLHLQVQGKAPRSSSLVCFLFLALFLCLGKSASADTASDFTAANELYAKGKYADAATAYEKVLTTGGQAAPLLFNYGNAEFKAGRLGGAIAAYRRAALLEPRDADLRANLAFVREKVQNATPHEGRWQNWVGSLTLNEGTRLAAVCVWLLFALLIARQIKPALAPKLRGLTRLAVVLTVFSAALLALQAANHFNSAMAVVTNPEATARSGPFDDAQSAFTAHDGAEMRVLDRHDQWVEVADSTGKIGWFSQKQVEVLPGA